MAVSLTLHKVCGKHHRTTAFKSIPARQVVCAWRLQPAQKTRGLPYPPSPANHPREKQNRWLRSGLLCLLALQSLAPCSTNQGQALRVLRKQREAALTRLRVGLLRKGNQAQQGENQNE
jgi:hypothetical protein